MKLGTILVATDTNPLYCDFIPNFVTAWKTLVPEADICIVMIADAIPDAFQAYSPYIQLFPPIPGMHTAFQAQCIRLLYPRQIARDEGVLITDMDMLPMRRAYYVDTVANCPEDAFVVYRDVCLPNEISMCYNIAHPATWRAVFGDEPTAEILSRWYAPTNYDGQHGGVGWSTDQVILVRKFNEWNGPKVVLNDSITSYSRLDRIHPWVFQNRAQLKEHIQAGSFSDYHCIRPYAQNKDINDYVVKCLLPAKLNVFSFCIYGPEQPKYHGDLLRNIDIITEHFPDWRIFIYVGADTTESYIRTLNSYPNVLLRFTNIVGHKNSVHRFFAIDEPNVNLMMVRDADSHVHWKDRWAINDFLASGKGVHMIRDHPWHTCRILAGLWGIRKGVLKESIRDIYERWTPVSAGSGKDPHGFGIDQNFLTVCIYDRIADDSIVHYSHDICMFAGEHLVKFPFEWNKEFYCGRREFEYRTDPKIPLLFKILYKR